MPSASNNNLSNTKLVKQTSVNSVNSGGASGSSKSANKKSVDSIKSSNDTIANNNETSSANQSSKEDSVAAAQNCSESSLAPGNGGTANAIKDTSNEAMNPMKLTFTTIEHKIRNLEKRKTKLEVYREIQASGKELSNDQRAAVAKYDAVIATLEFARDLVKQMQQFTKDAEKDQKKTARKELIAKAQAETIKIREVLIIQNILSCFTDEAVRNDFINGENGAVKLEQKELDVLEKFCFDIQTRRPETSEDVPFATSAQKAAEVFSMTIDARPKQYGETTYENVKRIFQRVQESEYLDKIYVVEEPQQENINVVDEEPERENNDVVKDLSITNYNDLENLHEPIDNMIVDSTTVMNEPVDSCLIVQQQPELSQQTNQILEHVDVQHVNISSITAQGQHMIISPMAPPAASVPAFQGSAAHSGTTTPVHVAMYNHPGMQTSNHPIQQIPVGGTIIAGVPQPQIVSVPAQPSLPPAAAGAQQPQQRQMLGSPSSVAQSVPPQTIPIHNTAQNQPLTQTVPPQAIPIHNTAQTQTLPPGHYNYIQQMRPLAEVIGGGNFFFLQDSELDSPELNAQGQAGLQNPTIFDQQQSQSVIQHLQKNNTNLLNEQNTTSLNQNQIQQVVSPQQLQQQHVVAQQPIQTQTFTNQSFPQLQNSNNLNNSTDPLFQQQQQLFNVPIQQNHGLQNSQQQPQLVADTQQPMMLINRLGTSQQTPLIQQQQQSVIQHNLMQEIQPQTANQQSQIEVTKNSVYPFENPVVGLNYEQQMQNTANALKKTLSLTTDESKATQSDLFSEFASDANVKGSSVVSTPTPSTSDLTLDSNKWTSDVNSNSAMNTQQTTRKNEWTSSSNANSAGTDSGYDRNVNNESNHWNSSQEVGGYRGPGNRNSAGYQRRDDRRVGSGNGGGNYRGRSNYGSSGASSQQNGSCRGGGNNGNSGIYFRNNENSNTASYYPNSNGAGVYSNKDNAPRYDSGNGGNYRPRSNNSSNGRSNGPTPRNIGSRGGNSGSSTSNTYMNSRQSSNRLPLGLENKN